MDNEQMNEMDNQGIRPGFHLPRGEYKHLTPGERPAVAQHVMDQERLIVERNRALAIKAAKQKENKK